jgi:two-component system, OmpR family, sensor histidine kinase MprB
MSLRRRLVLLSGLSVAFAILVAAVVSYAAVRSELRGQVDDSLIAQARVIPPPGERPRRLPSRLPRPRGRKAETIGSAQLLSRGGRVRTLSGSLRIPVTPADTAIARKGAGRRLVDAHTKGAHLRVLTVGVRGGGAVQLARSLDSADDVLARLRLILALLVVGGVAVTAVLARLLTRTVLAPLAQLEHAAEHITETEDLRRRIRATGGDEVGRLAARFNEMLDTLESSRSALGRSLDAQRQLLADASHELRTPVTGLRTNLEILADGAVLSPDERRGLLRDVVGQTEELSALITDVIELARGDEPAALTEEVRLDLLVEEAVARARMFSPATRFETHVAPTIVEGVPDRLSRAVNNLLDNAAKHNPPGAAVDVRVRDGEVTVRDHGSGVPAAEVEHIFDRFYRGGGGRSRSGSGLGLAIVRQVATTHGGSISVEHPEGGGALFRLALPS